MKASNTCRCSINYPAVVLVCAVIIIASASGRLRADTGTCGGQMINLPFTDVPGANIFFCSIAQIYFQGITLGTTPTTYNPADGVSREQMAAFLARSQNSTLNRGSRRAALNQFWTTTPQYTVTEGAGTLGTTGVGANPRGVASDGIDIWVANGADGSVSRVRGSDGKLLATWTGAPSAECVLVAMGRVFVAGSGSHLYMINPSQPAGTVTTVSSALGTFPMGIAFDGQRIWTANQDGSVSIITPGSPFTVMNVGGFAGLRGIVYDGASMWVTEISVDSLKKLDANGAVILTVPVGHIPVFPAYDGTNIWVPCHSGSVSVVRPSNGQVLATLTGNGLTQAVSAAFDGQRILITNVGGGTSGLSLFRAADFAPLGTFPFTNAAPWGACSDGVNFWITIQGPNKLARF